MNDNLNADFEKSYKNLLRFPLQLAQSLPLVFMSVIKINLIDIKIFDKNIILSFFVLFLVFGLIMISYGGKLIKSYCIKKQFSSNQLKRLDKIAYYVNIIIAMIMLVCFIIYFYLIFNPN